MKSNVLRLKERIKVLAALQSITKRARKTTLPKEEYGMLRKEIESAIGCKLPVWWDHNSAASDAANRSIEITAYLNMYHELRGSEHRHNIDNISTWYYDKYVKQIKDELAKDHEPK